MFYPFIFFCLSRFKSCEKTDAPTQTFHDEIKHEVFRSKSGFLLIKFHLRNGENWIMVNVGWFVVLTEWYKICFFLYFCKRYNVSKQLKLLLCLHLSFQCYERSENLWSIFV